MPLFPALRTAGRYAAAVAAAEATMVGTPPADLVASAAQLPIVGPESPFHPNTNLTAVVWADLLGGSAPVTRAAAMQIPAVARHRHLICSVVARSPLVRMIVDAKQPTPRWATRTDGELSPYHRMLWTADDLIFSGWSVWLAERARDKSLDSAERIAPERWETDTVGRVKVDGEYVNRDKLILIPGPHEGILTFGAPAIRRAMDNANAAANAARNPAAYLELHYTGDEPMTDPEIDALIERWAKARRGENGGVAFTNKAVEVKEHGTHESHLLIEGRNADAVDMARLVSNPASMADATNAGASLTYETTEGRNDQFLDYGASFYMDAIAARLSMDDVVPERERMAFETAATTDLNPPSTGPTLED